MRVRGSGKVVDNLELLAGAEVFASRDPDLLEDDLSLRAFRNLIRREQRSARRSVGPLPEATSARAQP